MGHNLTDLEGGFRGESHFKKIADIYGSTSETAPVNIYTKWKRNDGHFRTKVLSKAFSHQNSSGLITDNKIQIYFNNVEWRNMQQCISKSTRPRFLASANQMISKKLKNVGIKWSFKLNTNNSFTTSKILLPGHFYWRGRIKCITCKNEIDGFIKTKPVANCGITFCFDWNGKNCSENVTIPKLQLKGEKRSLIQSEITAKGVQNFLSERAFFNEQDKTNISYENARKLKSLFKHRFQLRTQGFIHDIESNPIGFVMFSEIQVKMWAIIESMNPVWFFDSTGNDMVKYGGQKNILLHSLVAHDFIRHKMVSIGDFVSSQNDNDNQYFESMIKINTALLDRNSDWFKNVCESISPEIDKKQKEKNKENVNESKLFLYQSIENL
ncbi:hypothetical protein BpHYR1_040189 [Brachionus plicatilis]|uniref:Uncharacterized protein n=1 Tax=Brachionus plicatilis TaxID=10195 RepID=A0A3M7Q9T0_BRAPC|nr:hypothetical protein BpHYR1_040189 [Brachionus plicatilis]